MSIDKKKNKWLELLRFLICGVVAALTDYLLCQLVVLIFSKTNISPTLLTIISTAVGFIGGVIVNYLISTYWVYQNVDKSVQTKSKKFIALFVLLSAGAMLLSIGSMVLCNLVCENAFGYNIVDMSVMSLISNYGWSFLAQGIFWAYFVSFCIKTIVGLIFNYFTRKYILYKAPKKDSKTEE